jgi:hypothetical protein
MCPETGLEVVQRFEVIFFELIEELPELDAASSFAHELQFGLGVGPFLQHFIDKLFALISVCKELGISRQSFVQLQIGLKFLNSQVHDIDIRL